MHICACSIVCFMALPVFIVLYQIGDGFFATNINEGTIYIFFI